MAQRQRTWKGRPLRKGRVNSSTRIDAAMRRNTQGEADTRPLFRVRPDRPTATGAAVRGFKAAKRAARAAALRKGLHKPCQSIGSRCI